MLNLKLFSGLAAMAFGAAMVLALPGFSPEADASTHAKVVKSDRLDFRLTGKDCSQQAWPYYEANCLRDRNQVVGGQVKAVRLITTDRLAAN
jgi:hypothetical protein